MNGCKKITILAGILLTALNITACGRAEEDAAVNLGESSVNQRETNVQTVESADLEIKEKETIDAEDSDAQAGEGINSEIKEEESIDIEESDTQADEKTDSEMTAEELFDLFINGSISAVDSADLTSTFYITDFDMDSYSIGEKADLDNDGENELIICGPYGGIYLDARDNKVYEFATGDGNALTLSYVVYNGATWIMYSNRMNAGYEAYHMEKYEGADHLVAEMNFSEESVEENNIEGGMKYTLNGTEISYDEYTALGSRIFATEVDTN
ncbi:MAG: hypothetical protein NC416_14300 [Eubacterium sp.]|nr:hypothetical protein [Eubacterium sp.]